MPAQPPLEMSEVMYKKELWQNKYAIMTPGLKSLN